MRSTHVHAMWCSGRIITPVSRQSRFGGHELGLAGKTITYTRGRREWVWSDADKAQRTESTRLRSPSTEKKSYCDIFKHHLNEFVEGTGRVQACTGRDTYVSGL